MYAMTLPAFIGLLCVCASGCSAFPGGESDCTSWTLPGGAPGPSRPADAMPGPAPDAAVCELRMDLQTEAAPGQPAGAFHLFSPEDAWGFMSREKGSIEDTPTPLTQSERGNLLMDKAYWSNFILDPIRVFKAPASWSRRAWIEAALIAGTTFALYTLDDHFQRWSQEHRGSTSDTIAKWVKPLGSGLFALPALAGFYAAGRTSGSVRAQETALLGFESLVLTEAAVEVLKYSAGRAGPGRSSGNGTFQGPSFSGTGSSFPSGQASSAFAFATIIALEYRDHAWVPPLAYGLATLTGLSRINDNAHWSSDVFLGAVLGYSVSRFLFHEHHVMSRNELILAPFIDRDRRGLMLNYTF